MNLRKWVGVHATVCIEGGEVVMVKSFMLRGLNITINAH